MQQPGRVAKLNPVPLEVDSLTQGANNHLFGLLFNSEYAQDIELWKVDEDEWVGIVYRQL